MQELVWSNSKVIRMEAGDVGISVTDLRALLQLYGITDQAEIGELTEMVLASRRQPWWSRYSRVVTPNFYAYLGYETSATVVRNFESNLVPGLLQTEAYMRALIIDTDGNRDQGVALRLERQQRIEEAETKQFFIMDEAATRRVIGGPEIMRAQLDHLLAMNERPNIEILVVPFERGIYPLFRSSYVIYEFPDTNDDLVTYVESIDGSIILSEKAPMGAQRKPSDYLKEFWRIESEYAEVFSEEFVTKVSPLGG